MDIWLSLDRLRAGQRGTVEKIGLTGPLGRRLTDLGLVEGTRVACRMTAPRGDPWPLSCGEPSSPSGLQTPENPLPLGGMKVTIAEKEGHPRLGGGLGRESQCGKEYGVQQPHGDEPAHGKLAGENGEPGQRPGAVGEETYVLVDLPGTYSLSSRSKEEEVAEEFIRSGQADCVVVVCDGTSLERNLILTQQVLQRQDQVVVCVNLMDEVERSCIQVDCKALEEALGVPVVATAAGRGRGMDRLRSAIAQVASGARRCTPHRLAADCTPQDLVRRAEAVANQVVVRGEPVSETAAAPGPAAHQPGNGASCDAGSSAGGGMADRLWGHYPSQLLQSLFDSGYLWLAGLAAQWGLPWYLSGPLLDGGLYHRGPGGGCMLPPMAIFFHSLLSWRMWGICPGCLPPGPWIGPVRLRQQALTMCMGLGCMPPG